MYPSTSFTPEKSIYSLKQYQSLDLTMSYELELFIMFTA